MEKWEFLISLGNLTAVLHLTQRISSEMEKHEAKISYTGC